MSYETVKSYVLVILIGVSVLLSVALWTYQPSYEQFQDPDYVNEVDVGGIEKDKKDLIKPSLIVFHDHDRVLGFDKLTDQTEFYQSMNQWVINDLNENENTGIPQEHQFLEVIYPTLVPVGVLANLFRFNEEIITPDWEFDRMYITFNRENLSLDIKFISVDKDKELTAVIDKRENYDMLLNYAENHPELTDYTRFGNAENEYYIPSGEKKIASKTMVISKIQPENLVNALFRNPSQVTPNVAEAYFTDGQRGMSVSDKNNRIEFINPIQTSSKDLTAIDLLDRSITNINEHKGWTNDYILEQIVPIQSKVKYRLMYDGLPVYDNNNLAIIEQTWRGLELYEYNRPLIRLTHEVDSTIETLPSGYKLINYIKEKELFKLDEIEDMQFGYELKFLSSASDSMLLKPTWYVKIQGQWQLVDLSEFEEEGGE